MCKHHDQKPTNEAVEHLNPLLMVILPPVKASLQASQKALVSSRTDARNVVVTVACAVAGQHRAG
jgi:hypothetical protein